MSEFEEDEDKKARLRLWLSLLQVSREIETEIREKFRIEFNTTLPRFDVMAALARYKDGLRMSELSKALKVSNGNVTGIVERLVDEGIIKRTAVPKDRRASHVSLTQKGGEIFNVQAKAHAKWIDELLKNISNLEANEMIENLSKYNQNREG